MVEDFQEQQRQRIARSRSVMDYVRGILLVLIGFFFLVYQKIGLNIFRRPPSLIDFFIGGLFILYGGWRIYRGYKKDYFR